MFKKFPASRRILIYVILSYLALILVSNSGLEYGNMWLIYTPMFVAIYIFSRWLDSRFGPINEASAARSEDVKPLPKPGSKD